MWFGLICSLWLLVFGYVVFGGFPGFGLRVVVVWFPWISVGLQGGVGGFVLVGWYAWCWVWLFRWGFWVRVGLVVFLGFACGLCSMLSLVPVDCFWGLLRLFLAGCRCLLSDLEVVVVFLGIWVLCGVDIIYFFSRFWCKVWHLLELLVGCRV